MSISTIIDETTATVTRRYPSESAHVVGTLKEALEDRESTIKDNLREFAVNKGLSQSDVDTLFVEVGLSQPAPEPDPIAEAEAEAEAGDPFERILAALSNVEHQIEGLVAFARRNGYSG